MTRFTALMLLFTAAAISVISRPPPARDWSTTTAVVQVGSTSADTCPRGQASFAAESWQAWRRGRPC